MDVRLHKRTDEIRWHYPIHNQLQGFATVVEGPGVIRSSYEGPGVLEAKSKRALPALLKLHSEATSEEEEAHAVYNLCRTYAARHEAARVVQWGNECRRLCPDHPPRAPFWRWLAVAVHEEQGRQAAMEVVEEGLRHHPELADLWHLRMTLDLCRWYELATDRSIHPLTAQYSPQHADNVPEVVALLGLQVQLPRKERSQ